jgi:hypothetical protein
VGGTAPAAPTIGAVTVTGDEVTIAWTPGASGDATASGFVIQYSADDTAHVTMAMETSTATSATLPVPSVDSPYSLRVATISSVGAGAFASVRPPLVATGQVSAVGVASAAVDATVHANTSTVATDFELATSLADLGTGAASVVVATPASVSGATTVATTATLTDLESGTTYYVRARATSANLMSRGVTRTFTTPALVTSTDLNQTYSGAPVQLTTVTEPIGLTVARTFEGVGDTSYPLSATAPSDVGTYRVTTTIVDLLLTGSEVATITIAPKPVTLMVTASDKQFDGTLGASLTFQLDGVISGDDVEVDAGKVQGAFATVDAAANQLVTINAEQAFLIGTDAANYTASMPTQTVASIERATQGVWFSSVMPTPLLIGSTYAPTAVSSMGLIVDISLGVGSGAACALSGGVVSALAAGECVIVAAQQGTANIEPALPVSQLLTVPAVDATEDHIGATGVAPDAGNATNVGGNAVSPGNNTVNHVGATSAAPPTGSPAPETPSPVDSNGESDSIVSAGALAPEPNDRPDVLPLLVLPLVAMLGGGFFIAGKRRWSREREG